jgi:hypothetical protein
MRLPPTGFEHDFTHRSECALKKYKEEIFAFVDVGELPAFIKAIHNHKASL